MRQEFPAKVKVAAFERANGSCENCTARLAVGKFVYDHKTPDWMGGAPTLDNCQLICSACDGEKTPNDQRRIAKTKRVIRRHAGIRKPGRTIPGRRFDGTPIPARWRA